MDGLIAPRVPWRNGTHTTNTRSEGSWFRLKMLFCTQLAPARHAIQVGEKISTSRVWPSAALNSDLRVEMALSEMTPPGRAAGADAPGVVDTGDVEHATIKRPDTTTATAASAARAGRDPRAWAGRISPAVGDALPIASPFPCAGPAWHRAGAPHPK